MHSLKSAYRCVSDEMKRRSVLIDFVYRMIERRVVVERSVLYRVVYGGDILIDHPARAEIEVSHLAVAHLPLGQSNRIARGIDERVRVFFHERIEERLARLRDRVPVRFRSVPEPVEYYQCVHIVLLRHFAEIVFDLFKSRHTDCRCDKLFSSIYYKCEVVGL